MPHRGLAQPPPSPAPVVSSSINPPSLLLHKKPAPLSTSPLERLRFYRKCYHDLDDQLLQIQQSIGPGNSNSSAAGSSATLDLEVVCLQAELRCLEELIMLFTRITSLMNPNSGAASDSQAKCRLQLGLEAGNLDYPSVGNDELDMSLLTDMLMLTVASPWTMFVTERSQWHLHYVSPSVKRNFGWRPSELIGTVSWDGCHPDDIPTFQQMLQSSDSWSIGSGAIVIYRRIRKDRNYSTVQATGRAIGTRWYAWVELDMNNLSASLIPRADVVDADALVNSRVRRQANRIESSSGRNWPSLNSAGLFPTAATFGHGERQQKLLSGKSNQVDTMDPAEMTNFPSEMTSTDISIEESQAALKMAAAQGMLTESYASVDVLR